jgi:hypothetical protein
VTVPEVRYSVRAELPCSNPHYLKHDDEWGEFAYCIHRQSGRPCEGCIGDGRRVDLSNGIPVSEGIAFSGWFRGRWMQLRRWRELPVEVSDLKEEHDG